MEQRQKETLNETNMSIAAKKEEEKKKGVNDDAAIEKRFEEWMVKHGKVYKDAAEKNKRLQIFKTALEKCESLTASHQNCTFAPNQYSDLNQDEVPQCFGVLPHENDIPPPDGGGLVGIRGKHYSFADVMDGKVKHISPSFYKTLKESILPIMMSRKGRKW